MIGISDWRASSPIQRGIHFLSSEEGLLGILVRRDRNHIYCAGPGYRAHSLDRLLQTRESEVMAQEGVWGRSL